MASVKTDISIPESLLKQAHSLARKMHVSQSELFSRAMREYMQKRRERQDLIRQINEANADGPDEEEKAFRRKARRSLAQLAERENT
jgi:hypothetical protein